MDDLDLSGLTELDTTGLKQLDDDLDVTGLREIDVTGLREIGDKPRIVPGRGGYRAPEQREEPKAETDEDRAIAEFEKRPLMERRITDPLARGTRQLQASVGAAATGPAMEKLRALDVIDRLEARGKAGPSGLRSEAAEGKKDEIIPAGVKDPLKYAMDLGDPEVSRYAASTDPQERAEIRKRLESAVGFNVGEVVEGTVKAAAIPKHPAVARAQQAKTFGEFWDAFKKAPGTFITDTTLESAPNMVPGLAAGAVAGPVAGRVGFAAAAGGSSGMIELGASINEKLMEFGADMKDPESIKRVLQEHEAEIYDYAMKRAVAVGLFDAAGARLAAGRLIPGSKVGETAAQAVAGAGSGMGGEIAAAGLTGQDQNVGAILSEGIGEVGGQAGEVAVAALTTDPKPAGKIEGARSTAPLLSPSDVRSPIDNNLIAAGKKVIAQATAQSDANAILGRAGVPQVGTRVTLTYPDGRTFKGTVADAFSVESAETGVAGEGVKIKLDDGQMFEELSDTIRSAGVQITPEGAELSVTQSPTGTVGNVNKDAAPQGLDTTGLAELNVSRDGPSDTPLEGQDVSGETVQPMPGAPGQGEASVLPGVRNAGDAGAPRAPQGGMGGDSAVPPQSPTQAGADTGETQDGIIDASDDQRLAGLKAIRQALAATGAPEDVVNARIANAQQAADDRQEPMTVWRSATGQIGVLPSSQKSPFVNGERIGEIYPHRRTKGDGTRQSPVRVQQTGDASQGQPVAEPTDKQKEAGNYQKRHLKMHGLDISIETEKGGVRTSKPGDPVKWEVTMPAHYGYIKRTVGADDEQVDVYVGPDETSGRVFIVDQIDPETGRFDEHKAMLGFNTMEEAKAAYDAGFSDGKGPLRRGAISSTNTVEFKRWLQNGDTTKPLVYKEDDNAKGGLRPAEEETGQGVEEGQEGPEADGETQGTQARPAGKLLRPGKGTITALVKRLGGIKDEGGDLAAMDLKTLRPGFINNTSGASIEQLGEVMLEEGFDVAWDFDPSKHDVAKVLRLIEEEIRTGEKPFALTDDMDKAAGERERAAEEEERDRLDQELMSILGRPMTDDEWADVNRTYGAGGYESRYEAALDALESAIINDVQSVATAAGEEVPDEEAPPEPGPLDSEGAKPEPEPEGPDVEPQADGRAGEEADGDQGGTEPVSALARAFFEAFGRRESFATIVEARKFAERVTGQKIGSGTAEAKQLEEAIEAGLVMRARKIVSAPRSPEEVYNRLVELYGQQPKLAERTSTSIENQAYSTPAPLAYLASRLAGIDADTTVYEPTAGNGMLLIEADPENITANELNPDRAENLAAVYEGAKITLGDAMEHNPTGPFDVVIMNPPFGKVFRDGKKVMFPLDGNFTPEIDHGIAWKALKNMAPEGKAVLIIGGKKGTREERINDYRATKTMAFFKKLYDAYNVADHFTVDGKLYERQGAGWPVDVIVIDGKGKSSLPLPTKEPPTIFETWEQLRNKLDENRLDAAGQRDEPGERPVAQGPSATAPAAGVSPAAGRPDRPTDQEGNAGASAGTAAPVRADGEPDAGAGDGSRSAGGKQRVAEGASSVPEGSSEPAVQEQPGDRSDAGERDAGGVPGDALPRQRVARQNTEAETAFQVQYEPTSEARFAVGTLVPRNMQTAMKRALAELSDRVGNIDAYVAKKLDYSEAELLGTETQPGYFSAEQVDALALAIDSVENGAGFIIGDQTGVGKGRFVAAMLRYAMVNNKPPVFITKDPGLYADMVRDLRDIGMPDIAKRVLVTNNDLRGETAIPLSADDATDVLASLPLSQQKAAMQKIAETGNLPKGYDLLFTTYSQLQYGPQGAGTDRQAAMLSIARNAVIVLDESHEAGGQGEERKKVAKDGTVIKNRADFIREVLKEASGAVYSSATYAKNPNVMSLYFKTDLSLAVPKIEELANTIAAGGVPLQQVVANMLVESGQYARRERSFEGVAMDLDVLPTDEKAARSASETLRQIFALDTEYMHTIRQLYADERAAEDGEKGGRDNAVGEGGIQQAGFSSIMHNVISQMLLSLKVQGAIDKAVSLAKEGKKPIIAVSNTNEAIIDDFVEDAKIKPGDAVNLTFNAILERYVKRLRRVTLKDADGNKRYFFLRDEDIRRLADQHALDEFKRVEKLVKAADLSGLPGSPIDFIIDKLNAAGIKTGEITGRGSVIRNGKYEVRKASAAEKKKAMNAYNSGAMDALVINRSGSTGFSMHATDKKGNDGKQRHMIVLQPDPNIDVFMQMLGRIHRTGQTKLPGYTIGVSDLAVEKRLAAVLMRKMASLNANTTASKKSAVSLDNVTDFLNKYGDQVVAEYLNENTEIANLTDIRPSKMIDGLASKFTGRLAILPPEQVTAIYADIEEAYKEFIESLDRMGLNALEAKTLELDAKTISSEPLTTAKGDRPFEQAAVVEKMDVLKLGKPYTKAELKEETDKILVGATPTGFARDIEQVLRNKMDEYRSSLEDRLQKANDALKAARTDVQKEKAQKSVEGWRRDIENADKAMDLIVDRIKSFAPGNPVILSHGKGDDIVTVPAVALGVEIKRVKDNPTAASNIMARFAIADAGRDIRIPLSKMIGDEAPYGFTPSTNEEVLQAFERGGQEAREEREIITGNLLTGFNTFRRGQITLFRDHDGKVRQGILLPKGFDSKAAMAKKAVQFQTAAQVSEFLQVNEPRMVKTEDELVTLTWDRYSGRFNITVMLRGGKPYYLQKQVRDLIGDFQQRRGQSTMSASFLPDKLAGVMQAYKDNLDAGFQTTAHKDEARKIVGEGKPKLKAGGFSKDFVGDINKVADALKSRMRQLGIADKIALAVSEELRVQIGDLEYRVQGFYEPEKRLIEVSLSASQGTFGTLNHEAIHAMRDLGLFTPAEWTRLENAARNHPLYKQQAAAPAYQAQQLDETELLEETIAEMFREYADRANYGPLTIRGLLERIKHFIQALRDALFQTGYRRAQDVFELVDKGIVGNRERGPDGRFRAAEDAYIDEPGPMGLSTKFMAADDGRAIPTETAAFARWFGNSKVVDADGNPLRVYHGTTEDIEAFDASKRGANTGAPSAEEGFFFTSRPKTADYYATVNEKTLKQPGQLAVMESLEKAYRINPLPTSQARADEMRRERLGATGPNVVPVYLSLQNPLIHDFKGKVYRGESYRKLIDKAKADGHDGLILRRTFDSGGYGRIDLMLRGRFRSEDIYVAFEPTQIKSAIGNRGTFDPSDPRIRFSVERRRPPRPANAPQSMAFDNAESEQRWQQARKGIGGGDSMVTNMRDWIADKWHGFARHYRNLPDTAEYADVGQQLRKLEAAPQASKEKVVRILRDLTAGMDAKDLDLFTRKVVLDDLAWEVEQEHLTPFGLTPEDVAREKAKIDAIMDQRPDLAEAVRQRKLIIRQVANDLVRAGVLHRDQVKNPAYYRHQVLDYARAVKNYAQGTGKKLKTPYWAKRMGSTLDINANLLEAEFDWLHKAFVSIDTVRTIDWIKRSDHNIRGQVIASAKAHNDREIQRLLATEPEGVGPLNSQWKSFRQQIAIGLSRVKKAIEDGDLYVPEEWEAAAENLTGERANDANIFPFLAWVMDNQDAGAAGAAQAFKAISQRREWVKRQLGSRYADPTNVGELVSRFAPEGYVAWQPDAPDKNGKALRLYVSKSVPEQAINRMVEKIMRERDVPEEFAAVIRAGFEAEVRSALTVGSAKYEMVIPEELADTLNNLRNEFEENVIASLVETPTRMWKLWTLFNPRRVLKYNLNNLSGDLDAIIAGNPSVMRKTKQAAGELFRVMVKKEKPTARYLEAVERGVFDSGFTVQEIPDINTLSDFERLTKPMNWKNPIDVTKAAAAKGWAFVRGATTLRENIFRYAAYLDFVERLEAGESMEKIGYGASRKEIVDAVSNKKDRAALLARDLIGDYGAISAFGQQLRRYVIPFWSFQEINLRRYWRLNKNAWSQGIVKGAKQSGVTGAVLGIKTTLWLYLRMMMVYGLIQIWNNLLFGDDEDDMDPEQRARLHLNLWKDSDGNLVTLRIQGSLSDAFAWFGFEDAIVTMLEVERGRASLWDILTTMAKAPVNKVANGITPVLKAPIEFVGKFSLFPDVTDPRPVRDEWRQLFRTFSLEHEYDLVTGLPSRGYGRSWLESVANSKDPGEVAYGRIKGLAAKWLEREKGQEMRGSFSSPRSDAYYNLRLAMKYGDREAERAARKTLRDLGATQEDIRDSMQRAHPLGSIAIRDRAKFLRTLTANEREALTEATRWYETTFRD